MHDMCQWLNTKSDLRPKQAWVCNCSKELFFTHIFSVTTTCFRQRPRTRPHHVRTHQNPTQRVSNSYSKGIPESPKVSPVSQEHYSSWDLNASKSWTGATLLLHPFPQPPPWRRPPNQHSHIPAPECAGLQHHSHKGPHLQTCHHTHAAEILLSCQLSESRDEVVIREVNHRGPLNFLLCRTQGLLDLLKE